MATRPPAAVDEWEDVSGDEWEDVSADVPSPSSGFAAAGAADPRGAAEQMLTGALKGGGRAALSFVNPYDWARAAKAAAALGIKLAKPPMPGQPYEGAQAIQDVVGGARDIAEHVATSPEAMGEVLGSGAVALAGPKVVGGAGLKVADIARRSRATNIVRAVSGPEELVPIVTRARDTAELPVSLTQGSLARKLAAREATTGAEVGRTRTALPGEIPNTAVAERLPRIGSDVEGTVVSGDRGLLRATDRGRAYWERLGEPAVPEQVIQSSLMDEFGIPITRTIPARAAEPLAIPRSSLAVEKTAAQDAAARGGAYRKSNLDLPIAPAADASMAEGTAIRQAVLDRTGLSAADTALVNAYEKALGKSSLAQSLSAPAQAKHLKKITGKGGGDWKASLAGRVIAPGLIGGTVGALGGVALSPLGALGGVGVAEFLKSTMWHTLSAATKLKAARALESGNLASFREIVVRGAIADVERRRLAEQALQAQGEGVTTP